MHHLMAPTDLHRRTVDEKRVIIEASFVPSAPAASRELTDWQIEIDRRMAQH